MNFSFILTPATETKRAIFIAQSDDAVKALALAGLNAGTFSLVTVAPAMADAEAVFDWVNLESDRSMNMGDVILWGNGRREVCLLTGWADI